MRIQYSSKPYSLGYDFSTPITRYGLDYHALVHSVGNPRSKNGVYKRGGGFLVNHRTLTLVPGTLPMYTHNGILHGGPTASATAPGQAVILPSHEEWATVQAELAPHGATGYKRARPGQPLANVGQTLVELREVPKLIPSFLKGDFKGIPRRAMRALASFRQLGSLYLNYQFGWKPFVSDLRKMHNLTMTIDAELDRLRRNNGRNLKRERVLRDTTDVTESSVSIDRAFGYLYPYPILNISSGLSTKTTVTVSKEKIWFEGLFRYWVPNIGTLEWEARATRALFGAEVTPSLLWEVMPWSWLIDWFSNAGDVISNMSANAVDNLVSRYAYVMRHLSVSTTETINTTWAGRTSAPIYQGGSTSSVMSSLFESKARTVGTPYGFGLTFDGLSGYQQSILAALAISRKSFL